MSKPTITIVGSAAVEVYAVSRHLKPEMHERRELIVLSNENTVWLDNSIADVGGGGLIAAITMARQKLQPQLVAKLGADLFGRLILDTCDEEAISTKHIVKDNKHHTDTTVHLTMTGKAQTLLQFAGSHIALAAKQLSLPAANQLYIATLPGDLKQLKSLIDWSKKHSAAVAIHPNNVDTLNSSKLIGLLEQCDQVFINRDELNMLLGGYYEPIEALAYAYRHGLGNLVLYDGLEGNYVLQGGLITASAAYKKAKPLESTGAEDVFCAAYLAAQMAGETVARCLSLATAQAVASMAVVGVRGGIMRHPLVKDIRTKQYILQESRA